MRLWTNFESHFVSLLLLGYLENFTTIRRVLGKRASFKALHRSDGPFIGPPCSTLGPWMVTNYPYLCFISNYPASPSSPRRRQSVQCTRGRPAAPVGQQRTAEGALEARDAFGNRRAAAKDGNDAARELQADSGKQSIKGSAINGIVTVGGDGVGGWQRWMRPLVVGHGRCRWGRVAKRSTLRERGCAHHGTAASTNFLPTATTDGTSRQHQRMNSISERWDWPSGSVKLGQTKGNPHGGCNDAKFTGPQTMWVRNTIDRQKESVIDRLNVKHWTEYSLTTPSGR